MSGGRPWTTDEARRLHELRNNRVPIKRIAQVLGRTPDAIYGFLRYVPATENRPASKKAIDRLPPRERPSGRSDYWTLEELRNLRSLAEGGYSVSEAAEALGRSYSATHNKGSAVGIAFERKYRSAYCRLEQETIRYHKNAVEGSAKLLDAILALAA